MISIKLLIDIKNLLYLKEKDKMILHLQNGDDTSSTDAYTVCSSKCGANNEEIMKLL